MERILFQAPSKHTTYERIFGKQPIPRIKLAPNEHILLVQRQHWLLLLERMFFPCIALFLIVFLFNYLFSQNILGMIPYFTVIQFYVFLLSLAIAVLLEIYIFMDWYYAFYVITTKCLLHMHFFRIGGYYFDEVFLDQISQQEISRTSSNIIYDLLDIYDVAIYFSHIERPEPFVFHAPSNSAAIEDILEELTVEKINRGRR